LLVVGLLVVVAPRGLLVVGLLVVVAPSGLLLPLLAPYFLFILVDQV